MTETDETRLQVEAAPPLSHVCGNAWRERRGHLNKVARRFLKFSRKSPTPPLNAMIRRSRGG